MAVDFESQEFMDEMTKVHRYRIRRGKKVKDKKKLLESFRGTKENIEDGLKLLKAKAQEGHGKCIEALEKLHPAIKYSIHEIERNLVFYGKEQFDDIKVEWALARMMTHRFVLAALAEKHIPLEE